MIVGMKYPNVAARSTNVTIAAVSHEARAGPWVCNAATRFATVKSVNGPVVTKAQNRRPLSGDASEVGGLDPASLFEDGPNRHRMTVAQAELLLDPRD